MAASLIVVGTSLGGLAALKTILKQLKRNFSIPIAVVQHRHKNSGSSIGEALQTSTTLILREVEDKDKIAAGCLYLAPADYHLLVEPGYFTLSTDAPVCYARPSIDVLFESAADAYAEQTVSIILTGANQDGATGAAAIKAKGGLLIVQTPDSAESPIMPAAAIARTTPDWVLPLSAIADRLNQL